MLAAKNEYLQEASHTIFELTADEQIRKQCRDREEYYEDLRNYERAIAERNVAIAQKDAVISEKDSVISEKDSVISEKNRQLQKAAAETAHLRALLKKHGITDDESV
ncbi:MAG: hypothetical protein NC314_01195 [Roseburia sp.]|nr:hypothetical protein [Roseburia sp.]MCM1241429.1 hypothetical protein [Roseburia sp.]